VPARIRPDIRAATSAGMPGPGRTPSTAGSRTWPQLAQLVSRVIGPPQSSNAWGFYITGSLRELITSGQGQPNSKE
jgi:hypothetical protein